MYHSTCDSSEAMYTHMLQTSQQAKMYCIGASLYRSLATVGKQVGLFATRSPHRPNNIGISMCRIESIDLKAMAVHLRGIDLVDGTPVLDIKPFVPAYDAVSPAHVAPWVRASNCLCLLVLM
jgi:tRNA (Thr-GGU) A37 N-methylase